jgi:GMP synthase-like glutamine amidotransferase
MQFIVNNESLWHCHPTGLCSSVNDVNYIVLAESSKSPEVIEHNHTIAMQFHIEAHYQSTIKLIQNFVDGKIELIQNKGQIDINY